MDLHTRLDNSRRLYLRYRRWFAAAAAAGCVLAVVHEVRPAAPATVPAVVAARDLRSGEHLSRDDLRTARLAPDQVPDGAVGSPARLLGEQVTVPLRSGEVVTDARLLSSALIRQYGPDLSATPVRLPDADVVALLDVGDLIDVYSATGNPRLPADRVVTSAPVVAVPAADSTPDGAGAVVVLALSASDTARLAQASATTQLSISMR